MLRKQNMLGTFNVLGQLEGVFASHEVQSPYTIKILRLENMHNLF